MAVKKVTRRQALRLADQLIHHVGDERSPAGNALQPVRAHLGMPMAEILAKVPAASTLAKARMIGVSRQGYYRWLDGSARPTGRHAAKIAELTGIDVEVITGRPKKTE